MNVYQEAVKTAVTIEDTIYLLNKPNAWLQGRDHYQIVGGRVRYSLLGAIATSCTRNRTPVATALRAIYAVLPAGRCLTEFNSDPETTLNDVMILLDRALRRVVDHALLLAMKGSAA